MSAITSTKTKIFCSPSGQILGTIKQICVTYDDTADVTIETPASTDNIHLLSVIYGVTSAHTLTIKSGTDTIAALEFSGATSLISGYINTGILFTGTGEALKTAIDGATGKVTFLTTTSHAIASAFFRVG